MKKENIYKLDTSADTLSEYDLKDVEKLDADYFIYTYESSDYEGCGLAVWRKDDLYYYASLGHCSCYGPVESLKSIPYSLEELTKILGLSFKEYSTEFLEKIKFLNNN